MGRPKTVSDEVLTKTARRCFLEHGPGLSIATIAAELGITDAAIIKRVGSKEALLRTCLSSASPMPWLETMRSGPGKGALADQLESLLEAICSTIKDRVPSLIAWRLSDIEPFDFPGGAGEAPPIVVRRELTGWLTRARATHGLELKDPASIAELLVSAAQSRALHNWISHGKLPETPWNVLIDSVLDGRLAKPKDR